MHKMATEFIGQWSSGRSSLGMFAANRRQGTTTVGPQFMSHDDDIENSYLRGSNHVRRGHGSGYCKEGSDSLRVWSLLAGRCWV